MKNSNSVCNEVPNRLWSKLGFSKSPYDTKPLIVSELDVDLLMGRKGEQSIFLTSLEAASEGVFVLSGVPGVGKTSFLNIQQYFCEKGNLGYGPSLLAARTLCPVAPYDEPKFIALKAIQSLTKSIEEYCNHNYLQVPEETNKIIKWVHQNKPATIDFGFSIFGNGLNVGREIHLPPLHDTTYETMVEILNTISKEVTIKLGFEGSFIVLDNIENLYEDELKQCLITFRDSLFSVANIWWILIGQSGLGGIIQSTMPKVSQRISGSLELSPISVEDLIKAVEVRVNKFHTSAKKSVSPIPKEVYLKLFQSSNGEIRFVFQYCTLICVRLINKVRRQVLDLNLNMDDDTFNKMMGQHLVKHQIDIETAYECLKEIIREEFDGIALSQSYKLILKKIGDLGKVQVEDYKKFHSFDVDSSEEFIDILKELKEKHLLHRKQEGERITFELRGIATFAKEYDFLNID